MSPETVLLVDDEPSVLDGLRRLLGRDLRVKTAVGGERGLEVLQSSGPFAVIVSDMRMPGLDGAQFLSKAKTLAPNAVRMMLTGHADFSTAVAAVNEGSIFRFLTKPCGKEEFTKAIDEALVQYRSARAEKKLLEKTALVWEWDLATGRVWRSKNFEEQFARPPAAAGEDPLVWSDLVHPEDKSRVRTELQKALATRADCCEAEYRLRRVDGSYAVVQDRASILYDAAGQPVRVVGAVTDLSEVRQLEEQFRQAQKLEAVGRLAGGVAHDFNNQLTVMFSYTEMIHDWTNLDPEVRNYAQQVLKACKRSSRLTQQLLAFSRRQVLSPRVTDLNATVEETIKMAARLLGEDIEVSVALFHPLWPVRVDPDQVTQVLLNLCVNARDAMPEGGKLAIATENTTVEGDAAESDVACRTGKYVLLAVTDSGSGMTEQIRARIFEPFFTTKEVGKGTGLGLSMVYGFVKQSKGFIRVDSQPGQGSSFRLYFPAIKAPLTSVATPESTLEEGKGETLLLVEDDSMVREAIFAYLTQHNYRVLAAANVDHAMQLAKQNAGTIQLLVTDITMPRMTGLELACEVAKIDPGITTLYISGHLDRGLIKQATAGTCAAYLPKPFTGKALAQKIREVIDRLPRQEHRNGDVGGRAPAHAGDRAGGAE